MTGEQKNKGFLHDYTEDFWNNGNLASFDKYFASSFVYHDAEGDKSRAEYKGLCQGYFAAFPDLHITTNDLIAEGDKVVKVWTVNCTHEGELMGIPPTGNKLVVEGIEVFRIAGGKIAELWASMDTLGMMQQIGAIPGQG